MAKFIALRPNRSRTSGSSRCPARFACWAQLKTIVDLHGNLDVNVRKAVMRDLPKLVEFTLEEARESEGRKEASEILEKGIRTALVDGSIAMYWVMVNSSGEAIGSISALKEWSDWNARFYW